MSERTRTSNTRGTQRRNTHRKKGKKQYNWIHILLIAGIAVIGISLLAFIGFTIKGLISGSSTVASEFIQVDDTVTVVLDAGHGGDDTGVLATDTEEKTITQNVISKLQVMLESQGYEVILTRAEDEYVDKNSRIAIANESSADLLVSVHCNYSSGDKSKQGLETYYKGNSPESRMLAENIQSLTTLENGCLNNGIGEGSFSIVTETSIPSVLVEVGYISNTIETEAMSADTYQNTTAKGIAKGIISSIDSSSN